MKLSEIAIERKSSKTSPAHTSSTSATNWCQIEKTRVQRYSRRTWLCLGRWCPRSTLTWTPESFRDGLRVWTRKEIRTLSRNSVGSTGISVACIILRVVLLSRQIYVKRLMGGRRGEHMMVCIGQWVHLWAYTSYILSEMQITSLSLKILILNSNAAKSHKCRHRLKVDKKFLLDLHRHTLEIQVWLCPSKLTARARYDRPKAFRLPVYSNSDMEGSVMDELLKRPSRFPEVSHDQHVRNSRGRSTRTIKRQSAGYGAVPVDSSLQSILSDDNYGMYMHCWWDYRILR